MRATLARTALAALAVTLAACSREPAAEETAAPVDTTPQATAQAVAPGEMPLPAVWVVETSGAGTALVLTQNGQETMRIACRRSPRELYVEVPGFTEIGSEDRMTVGAGDEAFGLVADLQAERPSGVEATGPIEDGLLERIAGGQELGVMYGAQQVGPLPGPDAETGQRFAAGGAATR